ncbi:MAG: acetyltransferase [Proteobacteria bacterium]|nr:acetyltransferase [Pseudomonadota bacterium]
MKPVVIFGTGELAELAYFYFTHDSARTVVAFTVDARYAEAGRECRGLPLVPFEQLEQHYPPEKFDLFVAIGYTALNSARQQRCEAARGRGYTLASYVSTRATTWPDLRVGGNCMIMEGNVVQPFVTIGDGVIMFASSVVSHHAEIGDWCFLGSNVTVSGGVRIGERSFIGVNSALREHIAVGADCIIGAGALILGDTPAGTGWVEAGTQDSGIPSRRLRSLL